MIAGLVRSLFKSNQAMGVQIISEILEDDLATKQDVHNLKQDIKNLDIRFETIEHKILQSEYRMTIKLGSIVTVAMAALAAVIKFTQ